jgi:hypothetical protein
MADDPGSILTTATDPADFDFGPRIRISAEMAWMSLGSGEVTTRALLGLLGRAVRLDHPDGRRLAYRLTAFDLVSSTFDAEWPD